MRGTPPAAVRRAADALLVYTAACIPLSTTGMQFGIGALAALALVGLPLGWGVVRRTPLDGVLVIFFGTLAFSTLASLHPLEASGWSRPWVVVGYFAIYWWLRDRAHAARFARIVVAAGAVVAAYGILQHFTGADWYRGLLGRQSPLRPREAGGDRFAVLGFFRSYLTFGHAMVIPLAWATALATSGEVLGVAAAVLIVVAILFSTARGAWIAGAAAVGTTAVLEARRAPGTPPLAVGALVGLGLVALGAFVLSPSLRAQAGTILTPGGVNTGRLAIYRTNLEIVRDHPVLGLGFGRYQTAAGPYYDRHPDADRRSHAHSNYLHMAAEAGLLGLAAFGLLYATALLRGWDGIARPPDGASWAAVGAWAGIVGFLVGGITQYNFGDNEVAVGMWAALAVLMRCRDG